MRKFLPALVIGILVLSGLGVSALTSDGLRPAPEVNYQETASSSSPKDYTHTVLVEVGTATWCPSCPASNAAWHSLYGGGNYNFEYAELVYDMNPDANARFSEFNPKWVPTSYWDGGQYVYPGTNIGTFTSYLDSSGARAVPDLVASLDATWLGGAQIEITYSVMNNEATNYPGKMRIYVQELESRWNDYSGVPYHHALIDMAKNIVIDIPATDSISDTFTWDGASAGYSDITIDNIQIILAVFDDTPHTSYSDPPSGNPFNAYYSDECIATLPVEGVNNPPSDPVIAGETNGNAGVDYDYTFVSTDPEGDDVYYWILWGDGCPGVEWIGPYPSGEVVTVNHTFAAQGTFSISAKAKDIYDSESDWGYLEVTMPRAKLSARLLILNFLERFPILRHILGL